MLRRLEKITKELSGLGLDDEADQLRLFTNTLRITLGQLESPGRQRKTIETILMGFRDGPYLSVAKMSEALQKGQVGQGQTEYHIKDVISDVTQRGNESICHLCLPIRILNSLHRNKITLISDIEELMNIGGPDVFSALRQFGDSSLEELQRKLTEFQRLRDTFKEDTLKE
jgi:hypothetical protein